MIAYFGLVLAAVLFAGISQVFLKIGSRQQNPFGQLISPYLNIYTLGAYAIFLFVTIITVIALQKIPLKLFYAITSLNFVIVALLSWYFLKERLNKAMIMGICLIFFGVMIFNI